MGCLALSDPTITDAAIVDAILNPEPEFLEEIPEESADEIQERRYTLLCSNQSPSRAPRAATRGGGALQPRAQHA